MQYFAFGVTSPLAVVTSWHVLEVEVLEQEVVLVQHFQLVGNPIDTFFTFVD